jgi:hypothetical protein
MIRPDENSDTENAHYNNDTRAMEETEKMASRDSADISEQIMTSTHTHSFTEVLSRDDGLTRRCQCGARLWEPDPEAFVKLSGGDVVWKDGKLVLKPATRAREPVKPAQEPVAWRWRWNADIRRNKSRGDDWIYSSAPCTYRHLSDLEVEPLYAAPFEPAAAQPQTGERGNG